MRSPPARLSSQMIMSPGCPPPFFRFEGAAVAVVIGAVGSVGRWDVSSAHTAHSLAWAGYSRIGVRLNSKLSSSSVPFWRFLANER